MKYIIIAALLCAAPAAAQDECRDAPDAGTCNEPSTALPLPDVKAPELSPVVKRHLFVMGVIAGMIDAQLEQKKKDPFYQVMPVDGGLSKVDNTVGAIMSPLCADAEIQQIMARGLNAPDGRKLMKSLGFTAFWCVGETGHKVYPAVLIRQKPLKRVRPDGKETDI